MKAIKSSFFLSVSAFLHIFARAEMCFAISGRYDDSETIQCA